MRIGLVNNSSAVTGLNMDVTNKPVETKVVKNAEAPKPASSSKVEFKAKGQAGDVKEQEIINEDMLIKSINQANKTLEGHNRVIERAVHEVTHMVMYTIKDTVTNEVIAEFPPKKIEDMIAKMWELAGLFVDEKA